MSVAAAAIQLTRIVVGGLVGEAGQLLSLTEHEKLVMPFLTALISVYGMPLIEEVVLSLGERPHWTNLPVLDVTKWSTDKDVTKTLTTWRIYRHTFLIMQNQIKEKLNSDEKADLADRLAHFIDSNWEKALEQSKRLLMPYEDRKTIYHAVRLSTVALTALADYVPGALSSSVSSNLAAKCRKAITAEEITMATSVESLLVVLTHHNEKLAQDYIDFGMKNPKWMRWEYKLNYRYSSGFPGLQESWDRHQKGGVLYTEFLHDDIRRMGMLLSINMGEYDDFADATHADIRTNLYRFRARPFAADAMRLLNNWYRESWCGA